MQEFLSRVVSTLAERLEDVQSIVLQGSQTDPEIVDMWSDYDLLVVLKPDACIDEAAFTEAIHRIGRVVGRETHRQQNTLLYRTALQWQSSVDLLDAKVRTYQNWTGDRPSTPPVILFDSLRTAASKKVRCFGRTTCFPHRRRHRRDVVQVLHGRQEVLPT